MIHFIRPFWLYLLIPTILYLTWVIYATRQTNPWRSVCDPHLLPVLVQPGRATSRRLFYLALFLFFVISIIALAGPAWEKAKLPIYRDISSTMLVLDLSSAMEATDLTPDRLTRAKFKIRDLINAARNTQMGLVVFTGEAFVAAPLSQDASTLNALLDELHPLMMPVAGSEMGEGLMQALTLLKQAAGNTGNVLLITASEPTANSWTAAKAIAQAGHHLTIFAVLERNATTQTVINRLQQLAATGGGTLHLITPDGADIQALLNHHSTRQLVKDENVENAWLWRDGGPWFCLLLTPFALLVLREKAHEKPT